MYPLSYPPSICPIFWNFLNDYFLFNFFFRHMFLGHMEIRIKVGFVRDLNLGPGMVPRTCIPLDHESSRYIGLDFIKDITKRHFYRFDTYCYVNHHTPFMILTHIHIHYKYKVLPPITYLYHSNPYIINNLIHHYIHLQVHYFRPKQIQNIKL